MKQEKSAVIRFQVSSLGTGYFYCFDDGEKIVLSTIVRPSHKDETVETPPCMDEYSHDIIQYSSNYHIDNSACPPASLKAGKASDIPKIQGMAWGDESVNRIVELWELSTRDRAKLVALGNRLQDMNDSSKNNPADVVRFLVANSGDITRAETQFRNMAKWRKEHHVDQILHNYVPHDDLVNYFPGAVLQGFDNAGDPIFLSRLGVTDGAGMLQRFGRDEMIKHAIWLRELICNGKWIQEYEKVHKKTVKQAIVIEDLHEIQLFRIVSNRPLLSLYADIMRLDQDNYPEAAKKIFIIRAPALFRLLWNIVQHFFDTNVREKMVFTSQSNFIETLSKYMDITILPPCVVPEIGYGSALKGMPPNFEGGLLPS
jgi:hypothetical protein